MIWNSPKRCHHESIDIDEIGDLMVIKMFSIHSMTTISDQAIAIER